jgi:hypothetical protein
VVGADIIDTTVDLDLQANAIVFADATAGNITINLPAAQRGFDIIVKKTDVSGNTVTLDGSGSEEIDGSTTYPLSTQYDSVRVLGTGSEWFIIGAS